jgi:DNA-directed RNA polymerase subunit K/omega
MEYKKSKIEQEAITRNLSEFDTNTQNLYETIVILSKRASQISTGLREELHEKLKDFTSHIDNLEEVFENREQIELAKSYEALPKPALLAIHELLNNKIYFRNPEIEEEEI